MKLSAWGAKLIKNSEGLRLKRYKCQAGFWTIGYGHLWQKGNPQEITQEDADYYFDLDVVRFEEAVKELVKVPLTQGQFDALVSFTFNLGKGALQGSTLLRLLNKGDYAGAAAQFTRWNKAEVNGVMMPLAGLTKRRRYEADMFRSGS